MKKLFLLLVVFAFVGVTHAQEKGKSKEISKVEKKNNFDEWSKELNLTETQIAEIKKIEADFQEKREAIRSTGKAIDFKNLNDEKKAAIDALLTPEQKVKQEQILERKTAEKKRKAELKQPQR